MPELHHEKLWTKSFITLTVCYLLLFMSLQMLLSPFPTYAKQQFQSDDFVISLVTSVFALAAIVTRFATAALMRKIHRNVLLFAGIVIVTAATASYAYAGSIAQLLLLRVLFGIGFGLSSTVLPTLVSEIIPRRRIGEGIGYFGLSTSLAMSFGPMIGLYVLNNHGFPPLTVLGALATALIAPLLLLTGSIPKQQADQPKTPDTTGNRSGHSKNKAINMRLLVPAALNMLMSITYGGILGFLALFGQENHIQNIGLFFLFNACTVLVIRPISGRIFDSKGPGAIVIPAAFIVMASLLLLSFTHSLPLLIVSALLYGLGFGAIQPTTQAWMLKETPPDRQGTANSLYYNSIDLGVAVGSMLLGVVASVSNYAVMYRFAAVAMVAFLIIYSLSSYRSGSTSLESANEPG